MLSGRTSGPAIGFYVDLDPKLRQEFRTLSIVFGG